MRFIKVTAENFSSYNKLEFDFSDTSLSLVHGATGAGKSTLMDMPCWALFGITAKDGNVDEVRSWNSPNSPTSVTLELTIGDGEAVTVTRVRGTPKQNDLYFVDNGALTRGKDITETQELINKRLGVTADLFLRAAYFSEFSPTGAFFTAKAKDRKQLFEIITDLSFPNYIQTRANEQKSLLKKGYSDTNNLSQKIIAKNDQLSIFIKDTSKKNEAWIADKAGKLQTLLVMSSKFEETKRSEVEALEFKSVRWDEEQLRRLSLLRDKESKLHPESKATECPTCGNVDKSNEIHNLKRTQLKYEIDKLEQEHNPYTNKIEVAKASTNNFNERIEDLSSMKSPFEAQIADLTNQQVKATAQLQNYGVQLIDITEKSNRLTNLYDIAQDLKAHLLHNSILFIQDNVNKYLQKYFDSEFTITFTIQDDNDLEVQIFKNGHLCVYTQLSKGQRGLLKLVFSVAVMQSASDISGVHFDNLFFDEPTDGTDNDLKTKSYRLFEELNKNHTSVLIIDHSDSLKALFNNQYKVELIGDSSQIYKYE